MSSCKVRQTTRRLTHDQNQIETTKNIYGHLFAQDRTAILDALNQAVSRLHAYESGERNTHGDADAVA